MRIVVFCRPTNPPAWSPRSVDGGIGGSEEAVIHMTRGLAARGHEVWVVNRRSGPIETTDGVAWTSLEAPPPRADVGVIWRRAWLIDHLAPGAADRFYLWLHDMVPQSTILPWLDAFEKVMVLSRFHRSRYPDIPRDKIMVTANGILPGDVSLEVERDPQLMVYGSCYTRGLRTLLNNWRRIREAVPGARLEIFYGWNTLQRMNPAHFAKIHPLFERLMRQSGIAHLGRLGHAEVARRYAGAGVWAYPCSFPETSCISAMKAQAAGAVPAVIPTGALAETVRHGFKTMRSHTDYDGMPLPRRVIEEWLDGVIALLRAPERQARIRADMMPDSRRRFAWRHVVTAWEDEFLCA